MSERLPFTLFLHLRIKSNNNLKRDSMIVLGIILMIAGGWIFCMGEERSCLLMTIGTIINFLGIGILMSAC